MTVIITGYLLSPHYADAQRSLAEKASKSVEITSKLSQV